MLHELLKTWFVFVEQWGYAGVFVLMALESSVVPVPSEVVIPPAAFWAMQGKMSLGGVIAAGALGSLFGSVISYFVAQALGPPLVNRFGRYVLLSPAKLALAENWVRDYGAVGVFFSRLLPVIRHLISIPAGLFRLSLPRFLLATLTGATLWCAILAAFGARVLGDHPDLLESPELMVSAIKAKLHLIVAAVVVLAGLYFFVVRTRGATASRSNQRRDP